MKIAEVVLLQPFVKDVISTFSSYDKPLMYVFLVATAMIFLILLDVKQTHFFGYLDNYGETETK